MIERTWWKKTYADGTVEEYNPFFQWRIGNGMFEVSTRHDWAIGAMWKWTMGTWTRYKVRFVRIGRFTFYVHYGMTKPHDPHTGEVFGEVQT